MKRRQLIRYSAAALLTCLGTTLISHGEPAQAQGGPLSIQWLGHTAFLFTGGGQRLLANPFRTVGCTAKYRSPKVNADLVMISSRLLDEGSVEGLPGRPKLLYEPGTYQTSGLEIQGIATEHDRVGGYRFGTNVAWKWTQAGVKVLHLGGIAAPISLEQKILMGQPDVLLIPVGNSPKAYTPEEAKAAVQILQPKLVIPTHYRTEAADPNACELVPVDEFLSLMQGTTIRRVGSDSITVSAASLPTQGPVIQVLSYRF
jgi:L-ascorbate metabolism protein UlaG (beta-lactamase superfamily)